MIRSTYMLFALAALAVSLGADDARGPHRGHELLEDRLGGTRPPGQLLELHRAAAVECQRQERSRRVVSSA